MSLALRCAGLTKRFGGVPAVQSVSLEVEAGTLLALLGPSGCGKTTLLRLIAGLDRPQTGTIEIAGLEVETPSTHVPPEKRGIGLVFQDYALFPHLTIEENVAFGAPINNGTNSSVDDMLHQVGLDGLASRMPDVLSGGQQQRVALARALLPQPSLIMLDEPFSNLDPSLRNEVQAEVQRVLTEANATAIIVTHDQEEALSLADEVAVMIDGKILQQASPNTIYRKPRTRQVAEFVGEINAIEGQGIGRAVVCDLGTISVPTNVLGPVDVLIRPEALELSPDPGGQATQIGRRFFGHGQMIDLEFDSGVRLSSRVGPTFTFAPNGRVRVHLDGDVIAFPKTTS